MYIQIEVAWHAHAFNGLPSAVGCMDGLDIEGGRPGTAGGVSSPIS